jgi:hypothetical protein
MSFAATLYRRNYTTYRFSSARKLIGFGTTTFGESITKALGTRLLSAIVSTY